MNTKEKGTIGEQIACRYLENQGMSILIRNYRCRLGEIDLIALQGDVLVFVEVKYRAGADPDVPLKAVDTRKQRRIRRSALYFLTQNHLPLTTKCRFDVIGIAGKRMIYIQNAFEPG